MQYVFIVQVNIVEVVFLYLMLFLVVDFIVGVGKVWEIGW